MIYNLIRREKFPLFRIRFWLLAQGMNCIHKLIDIVEPPVDRGVAEIGDLIDSAQFLQNFRADRGRLNLATAGFEIVNDFIDELLEGQQTGGTLLKSLGDAAGELASIERLMSAISFDHAQVGAFDFLISRKSISAFQAFTAATNTRAIARLAGVDNFIITRAALGATHSVKALNNTPRVVASTIFNAWNCCRSSQWPML